MYFLCKKRTDMCVDVMETSMNLPFTNIFFAVGELEGVSTTFLSKLNND